MAKVEVNNFNAVSSHTVTVSNDLVAQTLAAAGKEDLPIDDYFKAVFKFMIQKGMPLTNTEGMINAGEPCMGAYARCLVTRAPWVELLIYIGAGMKRCCAASPGVFPVNLFAVKQLGYFHADADEGIATVIKDM